MAEHKHAVITGAAGGIGFATALRFAAAGFSLSLVDLDKDVLQKVKEKLTGSGAADCLICAGDLSDKEFILSIIPAAFDAFGRIDVLVNNAAWRTVETMRVVSFENWEKTLRVCLTAPAFLAKAAAEVMEKQAEGGVIINISSVMSDRPAGYAPAYVSAKGALDSLTCELAVTYGRTGIRVVGVSPGFIDTAISNDYNPTTGDVLRQSVIDATALGRAGEADEVAAAISWLCSKEASFVTGTTLHIDGGFRNNFNNYPIKKGLFPDQF